MISPDGELLTLWTARIAVGCLVAAMLSRFASRQCANPADAGRGAVSCSRSDSVGTRWLWAIGCAVYLVHVACAFAFYHGWSHAAAYEHTAERTREVIGLDWGGGLYFNHVFTAMWVGDVFIAWRSAGTRPTSARFGLLHTVIAIYMALMALNATVVFGPVWWRYLAAALLAALLWRWLRRGRCRGRSHQTVAP